MSSRQRLRGWIAAPVLVLLAAIMGWGLSGAPSFGDFHGAYGGALNAIAVPQRHSTNVVTAIVFDYRGFDTMGEEFILFAAVVGVVLLLRDIREPSGQRASDPVASDAIRLFGVLMVGVVVVIGLWLAAFGLVTPGGGFQGGVVVAGGVVLVFLAAGYRPWRAFGRESLLDPFEGGGAAGYVALGLAALVAGAPFLHNLLGPGRAGTLASGGSMAILNWAVAVEVAAANLVLYTEFLESYLVPHLQER
jgi:multicomponent Na+:H+ antiporter subunit B